MYPNVITERRSAFFLGLSIIILSFSSRWVLAQNSPFVPGEVIVKLKPEAQQRWEQQGRLESGAYGSGSTVQRSSGGEYIINFSNIHRLEATTAPTLEEKTLQAIQKLNENPDVEYAQPNFIYQHHGLGSLPTDPLLGSQWHYMDNGTDKNQSRGGSSIHSAWSTHVGSREVVIAVLDTGIDRGHEDISGSPNDLGGYDFVSQLSSANDGDGRDSDPTDPGDAVKAFECGVWQIEPRDNSWHGTHVAGTVGIVNSDNKIGVAGVNWHVGVLSLRVLGRCGGTTKDIKDAIRWAAGETISDISDNAHKVDIINMSLGGERACSTDPSYQAALKAAADRGVLVVVSAGNDNKDASGFIPAGCTHVLSVAASDERGQLARYSNFGKSIDIMAPGGDLKRDDNGDEKPDGVLSTVSGGYAFYNGTSMAAPHVSGVAALMIGKDPSLRRNPKATMERLVNNAKVRTQAECPKACGSGLLIAE